MPSGVKLLPSINKNYYKNETIEYLFLFILWKKVNEKQMFNKNDCENKKIKKKIEIPIYGTRRDISTSNSIFFLFQEQKHCGFEFWFFFQTTFLELRIHNLNPTPLWIMIHTSEEQPVFFLLKEKNGITLNHSI